MFVEVKQKGGKPTPLQRKVHERLEGNGFRVLVLDSYLPNFLSGLVKAMVNNSQRVSIYD